LRERRKFLYSQLFLPLGCKILGQCRKWKINTEAQRHGDLGGQQKFLTFCLFSVAPCLCGFFKFYSAKILARGTENEIEEGEATGLEGAKNHVLLFLGVFPDVHVNIDEMTAEEDMVVIDLLSTVLIRDRLVIYQRNVNKNAGTSFKGQRVSILLPSHFAPTEL